ncbi:ABC-2 type transport system permease protein [Nocardia transvalensis]|uniref:ABC-2 type transport system permease protein n=1 Tax=Nocardia transvalensis TaxID=37333 RepID=A0A7W9PAB9_9NOCA|nr:ABC transporter permease [Nocardia transvalensis]MBB5912412.1 ABC-2 type transport system permease protein [Nocardia transvalensis]
MPTDASRAATTEIRKITTLRAGWLLLVACAAIGFVAAAVTAITGTEPQKNETLATGTASIGLYLGIVAALVASAAFAALGAGGEYRYRSMPLTALFTPDRDLLCGAKLAVTAAYSLLLALAAEVGAALGLAAFGRDKIEFGMRLVGVFGGGLLAAICWGVIGASLGLLLRSAVPALAAMAGWLIVIEPLLWLVLKGAGIPGVAVLLPGSATVGTVAVDSFPKSPFLPPSAASVVVLVAWAAAAGAGAWWFLRQREI